MTLAPATHPAGSPAPRLTVVVLSHNRQELLRRTLASVAAQTLAGVQVVVVDNGSSDGTPDMVRREFAGVELVALAENAGIRGRNEGFRAARAPLVLSLDDDVELLDPETLRRLVERAEADPNIGALTLKICDDRDGAEYAPEHWWHPRPRESFQQREFVTDHINEAAVVFRREALERTGAYYEKLFWGGEEWDLGLGLMDEGYDIRYFPEPVYHGAPRGSLNRRADPRHALLVRNRCWIALRRLPLGAALAFALPRLALWGARSLRYGYLRHYLRGVLDLARALPDVVRDRKVISDATWRRVRELRDGGA